MFYLLTYLLTYKCLIATLQRAEMPESHHFSLMAYLAFEKGAPAPF